eukprot:3697640-Amphidinium_carterae.1
MLLVEPLVGIERVLTTSRHQWTLARVIKTAALGFQILIEWGSVDTAFEPVYTGANSVSNLWGALATVSTKMKGLGLPRLAHVVTLLGIPEGAPVWTPDGADGSQVPLDQADRAAGG